MTDDIGREARDAFARDNFDPDWLMRRPGYEEGYLYGYRARAAERAKPSVPMCEAQGEGVCKNAATCRGSYEGRPEAYACDECCGHGCEDGRCVYLAESPQPEPQQPSTRELIATVRTFVDSLAPLYPYSRNTVEALTELEKRIGGE